MRAKRDYAMLAMPLSPRFHPHSRGANRFARCLHPGRKRAARQFL